jgi:hypothetical protein
MGWRLQHVLQGGTNSPLLLPLRYLGKFDVGIFLI